jgi:phosphodiesterase/alkaline phosphatase D-like protein
MNTCFMIFVMGALSMALSSCGAHSKEGLPPGSLFAGQGEKEKPGLPDGTAVGDITSHSAELWLKTQGPRQIQVEWASLEAWKRMSAMASIQSPAARTSSVLTGPETDFTLTVPLENLSPGTRYRYYILVKDPDQRSAPAQRAAQGEFTTLPDPATSVPMMFAWSGDLGGQERCRQGEAGYPILDTIREQKPDFFIFLGDTIYSDHVCLLPPNEPGYNFIATTLQEYRAKHHYQRGATALRRLLASVPVYVMWDDHEVKNNFAGPFEPQMAAGLQAFREYWPIHTDMSEPQRLYRMVRCGADLESAVPGYDGWAGGTDGTGFERERQVIVDAILGNRIRNVVFLAGDIHWVQANAYDPDLDGVTDFHEFVSGPLSAYHGRLMSLSPALHPTTLINEGGYDNFGLVRLTNEEFVVSIIDSVGKTRFLYKVSAKKR